MNKEKILSLIKSIITPIGAYLLGRSLFGRVVDENLLQSLIGGAMTIIGFMWSVMDKTASIEIFQSALRQVLKIAGGFLIASGFVKEEQEEALFGLITTIATVVYAWSSKKKSQQLDNGHISIDELKK